jgi:tetratricopeptide (TPR) repeat protein
LARGVEEALDPRTAASLLARRARLLEGPLGRPDDAANVYSKLLQLRPDDHQAASKLRDSLRRARRFQDLLVVIHKQTLRAKTNEEKIELLKETAQVWELDLRNRWEAVDAWSKVLELAPDDNEALRAMGRLDRRSLPPPTARSRRAASAPPASTPGPAPALSARPAATAASRAADHKSAPPQTKEDSIDLETLDEQDLEPVPVYVPKTHVSRRTSPPPPPPQAYQSGRPKPKASAPPPPPPSTKPRSNQ